MNLFSLVHLLFKNAIHLRSINDHLLFAILLFRLSQKTELAYPPKCLHRYHQD